MFQLKMKHVKNSVGAHWNILNSEILKSSLVGVMMNLFNNSVRMHLTSTTATEPTAFERVP